MRLVLGLRPLWTEELYATVALGTATVGFLAGIGCFDWLGDIADRRAEMSAAPPSRVG